MLYFLLFGMKRKLIYVYVLIALIVVIFVYLWARYHINDSFWRSKSIITADDEYVFEIETVKTILYAHGGDIKRKMIDEHPFNTLSCEEQHKLCIKALERLALKNVDIEVEIYKFRLVYLNEMQREDHVGMRCSTIPFIFLFTPGDPENKVKIVIEKNPFLDEHHELIVEIIKSASFQHAADLNVEKELQEYNFFNGRQRWEMCVAAKSRISDVTMLSSYDWSDTVGVYDVVYPNGEETKNVVAFVCNTSPRIYLRKGRADSKDKLSIMLEEN